MSATGHPDPMTQIAARLGQMPGQPGSPAGPQPLAAPQASAGPPGAPAGQGGGPGASGPSPAPGGPGGATPPPPQPQAIQTPPDLGQMFVQLTQRQQANEQFNRGLAGLTAAFSPMSQRNSIEHEFDNMSGDPGSLMGNLMKLQQYNIEQQQMAAYRQAIPAMLDKAGIDQSYAPAVMADPTIMSKILETQAGVGGNPAWQAQMHAEKALRDQGKPVPWTP